MPVLRMGRRMTATVIRFQQPGPGLTADTRRVGAPPTPAYLEARQRLGFPSFPCVIEHGCSWCSAQAVERCHVPGTGRWRHPHHARQESS